jgi:hypothetical protein
MSPAQVISDPRLERQLVNRIRQMSDARRESGTLGLTDDAATVSDQAIGAAIDAVVAAETAALRMVVISEITRPKRGA